MALLCNKLGAWLGGTYGWIDQVIFRGMLPTLHDNTPDHTQLKKAADCEKIDYPKPDGTLSFDKPSSVFLSNTYHEEDIFCHLTLKDQSVPVEINLADFDAPEQRYCPAGVYEIVGQDEGKPRLADQWAELHSLQNLRYQRPNSKHCLDRARRWWRTELFKHVSDGA